MKKITHVPKTRKTAIKYHTLMWNEVIRILKDMTYEKWDNLDWRGLCGVKYIALDKLFDNKYYIEMNSDCILCEFFYNIGCVKCPLTHKCNDDNTDTDMSVKSSWYLLDDALETSAPDFKYCVKLAESIRDLENEI